MKSRHRIIEMFDKISPTYDKTNRILSFGLDRVWRKAVKRYIPKRSNLHLLDLATGTCDQILSLKDHPNIAKFKGIDLSNKMLKIGQEKINSCNLQDRVDLELGNALNIPYTEEFDVVTMSFGIRNVTDPQKCLKEIHRVLKPKGKALILEFSIPQNRLVKPLFLFYLKTLLPRLGRYFSKDKKAYDYLNETIQNFLSTEEFLISMKEAGFTRYTKKSLNLGSVTLYIGEK